MGEWRVKNEMGLEVRVDGGYTPMSPALGCLLELFCFTAVSTASLA